MAKRNLRASRAENKRSGKHHCDDSPNPSFDLTQVCGFVFVRGR